LRRLLVIALLIELGLLLVVAPWSAYWDRNYFAQFSPSVQALITNNYARGAGRIATVKVYCGTTGGIVPNAVYTSTALSGSDVGNCTNNTFWTVARVAFRTDGGCDLTPIDTYSTSNARCLAF
jgi:hypothetical protein